MTRALAVLHKTSIIVLFMIGDDDDVAVSDDNGGDVFDYDDGDV